MLTPVVRQGYCIGVPKAGPYRELINSDLEIYGGSGVGNGSVVALNQPCHAFGAALSLTLPPLAALILQPCP